MFHRRRDASKVALVALRDILVSGSPSGRLRDVQWTTDHLRTLGAVAASRRQYLELPDAALDHPPPPIWARTGWAEDMCPFTRHWCRPTSPGSHDPTPVTHQQRTEPQP